MAEVVVENEVCLSCGTKRRENTQFCYNCGTPVAETEAVSEPEIIAAPETETTAEIKPASEDEVGSTELSPLDGLNEKIRDSEEENEKLAKAAAERKKARVTQKKPKQYVWEPDEEDTGRLVLLIAVLVAVAAAAIVFVTIRWK
jgi:hypothetical protein